MKKSLSSPSLNPYQNNHVKPLQIAEVNQKWICPYVNTPIDLLLCPICYEYVYEPIQCANCGRLFCKTDYNLSKQLFDRCPMCKHQPWTKKDSLHISYKTIIHGLKFNCQKCPKVNLTIQQLSQHLFKQHNLQMKIFRQKMYDYTLQYMDGKTVDLDFYQNLQINYQLRIKKQPKSNILQILCENQTIIFIDISSMNFTTQKMNAGKLSQKQSETIKANVQYPVWLFNNNIEKVLFLGKYQERIQNQYQQYCKNPNLSETHIDIPMNGQAVRYRIMFQKMRQVNTKSQFKRAIFRQIIKFGQ